MDTNYLAIWEEIAYSSVKSSCKESIIVQDGETAKKL